MIDRFITRQKEEWDLLRTNHRILAEAPHRDLGDGIRLQLVVYRKASASADVDKALSGGRPCFLCRKNRPAEQGIMPWLDYEILLNPYPLHHMHLTVPSKSHQPQLIVGKAGDMMSLARMLADCLIFYNGPRCGASAPDHFHFQTVGRELAGPVLRLPFVDGSVRKQYPYILLDNPTEARFSEIVGRLPAGDPEPMMNVMAVSMEGGVRMVIVPRARHRPSCYGDLLVSPASLEMLGLFSISREEDFCRFDGEKAREILREVCMSEKEFARLEI